MYYVLAEQWLRPLKEITEWLLIVEPCSFPFFLSGKIGRSITTWAESEGVMGKATLYTLLCPPISFILSNSALNLLFLFGDKKRKRKSEKVLDKCFVYRYLVAHRKEEGLYVNLVLSG